MSRKLVVLLSLLLLAVFAGAVLAMRLPSAEAVSVRAKDADSEQILVGRDERRTASELLPGETLDINSASSEELQKLPGIGPVLSEAIVQYRIEHGPFTSVEEIMNVPGIGQSRFDAIAGSISLEETP